MTKTGEAARPTPDGTAETITEWLITHQKNHLIGAIVVSALGGGGWLWQRSAQIKETKAAEALQGAEAAFSAGNMPLAQVELGKITARYPGTGAGTQAAMMMAQTLFDEGKFAEGIAQLEPVTRSAPKTLRAGVHALIAGGLEGEGKASEASVSYATAAAAAQFKLDGQMYRMESARTLVAAGDLAAARSIFEEISILEDSPFAGEAKVRLGELLAKK